MTLPGYEHNGLTIATIWMFTARRRATPQEMEQGEDEMRRAQERLDAEVAAGAELPLKDKGQKARVLNPPKSPKGKKLRKERRSKSPNASCARNSTS